MKKNKIFRGVLAALISTFLSTAPSTAHHVPDGSGPEFLISSARGSGWDVTARGVGRVLETTGLSNPPRYLNLTRAHGSRGVLLFSRPANQARWSETLMVQSAPLILRHLVGEQPQSWRDLEPVAIVLEAYQAIGVPSGSPYRTIQDLLAAVRRAPETVPIAGSPGHLSLDHLTMALVLDAAGIDHRAMRYLPSDGGGDALRRVMKGDAQVVVGGLGELIAAHRSGSIRILGTTSDAPVPGIDVPTLASQDLDVVFTNWRGFFARPGMSGHGADHYRALLVDMARSPEWGEETTRYGWKPLVLTGEDMTDFLTGYEADMQRLLAKFKLNP